ncbi:MAG: hypothetical protein GPJ52_06015 [Candidatus Heimdallarchaeota archaeon]|nr:hypothetical protein [Candidatus Heimdallarchaeota archaeon]
MLSSNNDVVAALLNARDNDKSEIVRVSAEWVLNQIVKTRGHSSLQVILDDMED